MPSRWASARREAANSTGSVTSAKSDEAPKSGAPAHITGCDPMARPPKKTSGAMLDPALTSGTMADRNSIGA